MRPFFFFINFDKELRNHYLAYFDILGYKSFFEKGNSYEFLNVIKEAVEDVKKSIHLAKALNMDQEINYRVYSDNFLFYIEENNNELEALMTLSFLLSKIQQLFLTKYSLLIRGGITQGSFYANEEYLFGAGLIRAYELENCFANYPRIIFDNQEEKFSQEIIKALEANERIQKDSDGYYYVQFLTDSVGPIDYDKMRGNIKNT